MNTQISNGTQYRNIVRKFFFRQNPPKPLTKEEFIHQNGLEHTSTKKCEERYYSYLYYYNYQYIKTLDEKVDREIREGALEDPYLAEIEQSLRDEGDSSRKPKKKRSRFNRRKKIKPIKKKHRFKDRKKKKIEPIKSEKPTRKNIKKIVALGALSTLFFAGGAYGLFRSIPNLILSGFDFASCAIPILASAICTTLGVMGTQLISYINDKEKTEEEEEYDLEEDEIATVNELKNKLAKGKEKKKDATSIQDVQLKREMDPRKPQFASNQEENHQKLQIANPLLNQNEPSELKHSPKPTFIQKLEKEDAGEKENQITEEPKKLKLVR